MSFPPGWSNNIYSCAQTSLKSSACAFCTRYFCSQNTIKDPPPSLKHDRIIREKSRRTLTEEERYEVNNNGPLRMLKDWNLQVRRILQLHGLFLHHLQEKLLLMLPIWLQ